MKYNTIKTQKGLTLIELMIAVVLGIFITGGMIQIFTSSKQNYRVQENLSRLQENGRFAMDFIARDVRMASYWGCVKNGLDTTTNGLDSGKAPPNYDVNYHGFAEGVTGLNGGPANIIPDTLTLRGAFNGGLSIITPYAVQPSDTLNISAGNNLVQSDIVMISDCEKSDIFQITNANPSAGQVSHVIDNTFQPGNINVADPGCPAGHCLSKVYLGDASIYKISTIAYSIQNGASGEPSLFRRIDSGATQELIEGIENMQVLYGEDTDNDSTPNYYLPAGSAGLNLDNVVSIRVSLVARTLNSNLLSNLAAVTPSYTINGTVVTPPDDHRIRRVFTSTIAVRNRLP